MVEHALWLGAWLCDYMGTFSAGEVETESGNAGCTGGIEERACLDFEKEEHEKMKILLVQGSPHKKGSSNMLAEQFMEGAKAAGHTVSVFDAAHADLHPALAVKPVEWRGTVCSMTTWRKPGMSKPCRAD